MGARIPAPTPTQHRHDGVGTVRSGMIRYDRIGSERSHTGDRTRSRETRLPPGRKSAFGPRRSRAERDGGRSHPDPKQPRRRSTRSAGPPTYHPSEDGSKAEAADNGHRENNLIRESRHRIPSGQAFLIALLRDTHTQRRTTLETYRDFEVHLPDTLVSSHLVSSRGPSHRQNLSASAIRGTATGVRHDPACSEGFSSQTPSTHTPATGPLPGVRTERHPVHRRRSPKLRHHQGRPKVGAWAVLDVLSRRSSGY